jgi:hypothetical protein
MITACSETADLPVVPFWLLSLIHTPVSCQRGLSLIYTRFCNKLAFTLRQILGLPIFVSSSKSFRLQSCLSQGYPSLQLHYNPHYKHMYRCAHCSLTAQNWGTSINQSIQYILYLKILIFMLFCSPFMSPRPSVSSVNIVTGYTNWKTRVRLPERAEIISYLLTAEKRSGSHTGTAGWVQTVRCQGRVWCQMKLGTNCQVPGTSVVPHEAGYKLSGARDECSAKWSWVQAVRCQGRVWFQRKLGTNC